MKQGRRLPEKGFGRWSEGIRSGLKVVVVGELVGVPWLEVGGSQRQQRHTERWLEDMDSIAQVKVTG